MEFCSFPCFESVRHTRVTPAAGTPPTPKQHEERVGGGLFFPIQGKGGRCRTSPRPWRRCGQLDEYTIKPSRGIATLGGREQRSGVDSLLIVEELQPSQTSDISDRCKYHTDHFPGSASCVQVFTGLIYDDDVLTMAHSPEFLSVVKKQAETKTKSRSIGSERSVRVSGVVVIYRWWSCYHACVCPGLKAH